MEGKQKLNKTSLYAVHTHWIISTEYIFLFGVQPKWEKRGKIQAPQNRRVVNLIIAWKNKKKRMGAEWKRDREWKKEGKKYNKINKAEKPPPKLIGNWLNTEEH